MAVKRALKAVARGVAWIIMLPLAASFWFFRALSSGPAEGCFQSYSAVVGFLPGLIGLYLRRAFYQHTLIACAPDCNIAMGTVFATTEVRIGRRAIISLRCNIAHADIGDDAMIGVHSMIMAGTRQHRFDRLDIPIKEQQGSYTRVRIGNDTWLGNGALVMHDIGDHAIVAAGSVVTKPVPEKAVVGGNPAQVLMIRGDGTEASDSSHLIGDPDA